MKQALNRAALAAALALGLAAPAAAQPAAPAAAADSSAVAVESYRREVFRYQRGGRPDPFQPLLSAADLGYRVEDIRLTSIVYSPDPRQSIAVFALADSSARHRLRTGQRLGSITVVGIYPRRVDVQVNDFGTVRLQSLTLQRNVRPPAPGPGAGAATLGAGQPGGPQQVIIQAPPPAAPAAPTGPLRRGGQPRQEQQPAAGQASPQTQTRTPGAESRQRTSGSPNQQRYR